MITDPRTHMHLFTLVGNSDPCPLYTIKSPNSSTTDPPIFVFILQGM